MGVVGEEGGSDLVSCPSRWSLYRSLALCLDHLSSFQQRDGYSNVLGMVRTLEIVLCFLDISMVTIDFSFVKISTRSMSKSLKSQNNEDTSRLLFVAKSTTQPKQFGVPSHHPWHDTTNNIKIFEITLFWKIIIGAIKGPRPEISKKIFQIFFNGRKKNLYFLRRLAATSIHFSWESHWRNT